MIIRACDLETTGLDASDEVVEIGAHDIRDGHVYTTPYRTFVKPAAPIPASSSAVHHIVDADVADAPPWNEAWRLLLSGTDGLPDSEEIVFIAHMASFERQWLDRLMSPRWICTWKASLRQWPEFQSHSLQALRYELRLDPIDPTLAAPPHRAAPDAYVCGLLLLELLKHQTIETLIAWSAEPPMLTTFDFGQFKGKPLTAADDGYMDWLANKEHSMGDDWRWNASREIKRRRDQKLADAAATRRADADRLIVAIGVAATVRDLEIWWINQGDKLGQHGIIVGTDEYDRLIAACVARKAELQASGEPRFEQRVPA